MTSPIDDVSDLCGKALLDQVGNKIGSIKDIYAVGDGRAPAWVTVETSTGMAAHEIAFVPIARLKEEDGEIAVPYSTQHVQEAPQVEPGDELSEEDERKLRDYYAIGLADTELRTDNDSYAARMPQADGTARRLSDGDHGDLASTSEAIEKTEGDVELKKKTREVTFDD